MIIIIKRKTDKVNTPIEIYVANSKISMSFVSYLMYPTLCRQAFALLKCHPVNGKEYLLADLQEECWKGRHQIYFIVSTIPQIILYVLGIPFAGLMTAFRSRKKRKKKRFSISMFRYGMLYSAFGPTRWYWGAIIASRKAFVALITSYLSDASLEVHWTVAFLGLSIILNAVGRPYTSA